MNVNKALFKFIKVALGVLIVLLVVYATVSLCGFGFDFGYRVFNEPAVSEAPGEDIMISIDEGMSSREIGKMLEEKGLVNDGTLFAVQLALSAYKDDMKPGVYTLNTSMTAKDMMVRISEVYQAKIKAEKEAEEKKQQSTQSDTTKSTQSDTQNK